MNAQIPLVGQLMGQHQSGKVTLNNTLQKKRQGPTARAASVIQHSDVMFLDPAVGERNSSLNPNQNQISGVYNKKFETYRPYPATSLGNYESDPIWKL